MGAGAGPQAPECPESLRRPLCPVAEIHGAPVSRRSGGGSVAFQGVGRGAPAHLQRQFKLDALLPFRQAGQERHAGVKVAEGLAMGAVELGPLPRSKPVGNGAHGLAALLPMPGQHFGAPPGHLGEAFLKESGDAAMGGLAFGPRLRPIGGLPKEGMAEPPAAPVRTPPPDRSAPCAGGPRSPREARAGPAPPAVRRRNRGRWRRQAGRAPCPPPGHRDGTSAGPAGSPGSPGPVRWREGGPVPRRRGARRRPAPRSRHAARGRAAGRWPPPGRESPVPTGGRGIVAAPAPAARGK